MRIRLIAGGEERSFDSGLGRFTDAEAIPCFRCGVCCRRWQPLVTRMEAERIAVYLGISTGAFLSGYTRPYPFDDDTHQLRERDGGCVFLRFDGGLAACAVHEARPQACRDWDASLRRKECVDGIPVQYRDAGMLIPLPLYTEPEEQRRFEERLRSLSPNRRSPANTTESPPNGLMR